MCFCLFVCCYLCSSFFDFCFVFQFNCFHTRKVTSTHTLTVLGWECVSMESSDEMCVLFHHIHSTSQCKHWLSCLNYTTIHTLECEYNDEDDDTNALHVNECACVCVSRCSSFTLKHRQHTRRVIMVLVNW